MSEAGSMKGKSDGQNDHSLTSERLAKEMLFYILFLQTQNTG